MLIDETTLGSLPPLYKQEDEDDPVIYAKLATPDGHWSCYVAEAGKKNNEYTVFGLFISKRWGHNWAQVPLREIEEDLQDAGLKALLVSDFAPDRASSLTNIPRRIPKAPATAELPL